MSRVLNLATLLFTIIFSGFLLLYVDWKALTEQVRASTPARCRCGVRALRSVAFSVLASRPTTCRCSR